jgi:hypothetical protein
VRALDSKQIYELHDNSDSFTETCHNKDTDTATHTGPDAKINRAYLSNSNSGCNFDDGDGEAQMMMPVVAVEVVVTRR